MSWAAHPLRVCANRSFTATRAGDHAANRAGEHTAGRASYGATASYPCDSCAGFNHYARTCNHDPARASERRATDGPGKRSAYVSGIGTSYGSGHRTADSTYYRTADCSYNGAADSTGKYFKSWD
jgi:hypothetical protein